MRKKEIVMTVFATFIFNLILILPVNGRQEMSADVDKEEVHKSSEIKFLK